MLNAAFSISPFFSLALGLCRGQCRSAPPLRFFFISFFIQVGHLRRPALSPPCCLPWSLWYFFLLNLVHVSDGGLEARGVSAPLCS